MVKADTRKRDRGSFFVAFSLFVAMLALYTLTASGSTHSNDEMGILAVTESLVKRGTFDANIASRLYHGGFDDIVVPGAQGTYFTVKGITPSLLAAPFYALAVALPPTFSLESVTILFGPVAMALAVALFFAYATQVGYGRGIALAGALGFGMATYAWPYAEGVFTETSAMLLLVATLLLLERAIQRDDWRWGALAGVAYGGAVGSVLAVSLLAPAIGGYALVRLARRDGERPESWRRVVAHPIALALAGGAAIIMAGLAAYNWARFGGPTMQYFSHAENDLNLRNWQVGLPGLLFHLDRGLLLHIPVFVLLPWGLWLGWRERRPEVFVGPWGLAALALFYGSFNRWEGGVAWGARYLAPVTPLLCLSLLPVLANGWRKRQSWTLGLLGVLTAISLYTQALGAFGNWVPVVSNLVGRVRPAPGLTTYRLPHGPQDWVGLTQLAAIGDYPLDVWWAGGSGHTGAWILGAVFAAAIGGMAVTLRRGKVTRWLWTAPALGLVAWLAVLPGYARLRGEADFIPALDTVATQARPDDVVLVVGRSGFEEFMRAYRGGWVTFSGRVHAYPLDPAAEGIVQQAIERGPRVWMLSTGFAPADPGNGMDRWLTEHAYKAAVGWQGEVLVTLYGMGTSGQPTSLEAVWGETLRLDAYAYGEGPFRPGEVVALDLTWRALSQPETDYGFFVHLTDASGSLVAQTDFQAQGGYGNRGDWEAGESITDRVGLNLPLVLPPGQYALTLGVIDPQTNERLTVQGEDGLEGDSLPLGSIEVVE